MLHVRHVLHRRTVLDAAAVHIVSTTRLGRRPLLAHVCYYAGMPRTFRAPRFTMDDIDTLSARLAQTVPLATTRRRALVRVSRVGAEGMSGSREPWHPGHRHARLRHPPHPQRRMP